jgi:hypothetical protein
MSSVVDISDNDSVYDVPEVGTMIPEHKKKADEILSSYSDRERQHIFDADHRDNYLASLLYYAEKLKGPVNSAEFLSRIPEPTDVSMEDITPTPEPDNENAGETEAQEKKKVQAGRKPPRRSNSGNFSNPVDLSLIEGNHQVVSESGHEEVVETFTFRHDKNPYNALYSEGKSYLVKEILNGANETTTDEKFKINVLFDGEQRTSCTFRIDMKGSVDDKGLTHISADADGKWADLHLIGPHRDPNVKTNMPPFDSKICLECTESYPEDKDVYLPDRTLISRVEDDAVLRVLRTDQELYRRFMLSAKERVSNLLQSGVQESVLAKAQERRRWIEIENVYLKQVKKMFSNNFFCLVLYLFLLFASVIGRRLELVSYSECAIKPLMQMQNCHLSLRLSLHRGYFRFQVDLRNPWTMILTTNSKIPCACAALTAQATKATRYFFAMDATPLFIKLAMESKRYPKATSTAIDVKLFSGFPQNVTIGVSISRKMLCAALYALFIMVVSSQRRMVDGCIYVVQYGPMAL